MKPTRVSLDVHHADPPRQWQHFRPYHHIHYDGLTQFKQKKQKAVWFRAMAEVIAEYDLDAEDHHLPDDHENEDDADQRSFLTEVQSSGFSLLEYVELEHVTDDFDDQLAFLALFCNIKVNDNGT